MPPILQLSAPGTTPNAKTRTRTHHAASLCGSVAKMLRNATVAHAGALRIGFSLILGLDSCQNSAMRTSASE